VAALDPNDSEKHTTWASRWPAMGDSRTPIVAFRAAVRLKPDYAKAHANLGSALASLGQLDEAIEEFTKALRIDPGSKACTTTWMQPWTCGEQPIGREGR